DPSDVAVVHPPVLGLEPFPEGDDGRVRPGLEEPPDLVVERAYPQALPGGGLAATEALGERVVESLDERDRPRVLEHALLGGQRPVIERPERGLGDARQRHTCWATLITVPSGSLTKKRRMPHGSFVSG